MSLFSSDLGLLWIVLSCLLATVTLVLLARESFSKRLRTRPWLLFGSGLVSVLLLLGTIVRPRHVVRGELGAGASLAVLIDSSLRLELPGDGTATRAEVAEATRKAILERFPRARITTEYFGTGEPTEKRDERTNTRSELERALRHVAIERSAPPDATIVVSDGRFEPLGSTYVPSGTIHAIGVASREPEDIAIVSATTSGVAVAHEAFPLRVVVHASSDKVTQATGIVVHELLEGAPPRELAKARIEPKVGENVVEMSVTLERAGERLLEVSLADHAKDEVPDNDRALVTLDVRRSRLRILHVAGRPTYDARALRHFLKSDEGIDLVAFFILRRPDSEVVADERELALIPFPVEELFTEHLPSFDAIILQDIDATVYRLARHLPSIAGYVRGGGGLVMVGGPAGFAGGGYANSPLEAVLPVAIPPGGDTEDLGPFEPVYTRSGRSTPVLAGIRSLLGERLPRMPGTNLVGAPKPGAQVLWEHPTLGAVRGGGRLPVLSLYEVSDGRSIALTVDGTQKLLFGELASEHAGRAHTALWEGLLGWLMRDPRYERTRLRPEGECAASRPWDIAVDVSEADGEEVRLSVGGLGASANDLPTPMTSRVEGGFARFRVPPLARGGYALRAQLGDSPPTRMVVPCEAHGGTFRESRPNPDAMRNLAERAKGLFVDAKDVAKIPEPILKGGRSTVQHRPLLPPYVWSVLTALALALHYWIRRFGGLG